MANFVLAVERTRAILDEASTKALRSAITTAVQTRNPARGICTHLDISAQGEHRDAWADWCRRMAHAYTDGATDIFPVGAAEYGVDRAARRFRDAARERTMWEGEYGQLRERYAEWLLAVIDAALHPDP